MKKTIMKKMIEPYQWIQNNEKIYVLIEGRFIVMTILGYFLDSPHKYATSSQI